MEDQLVKRYMEASNARTGCLIVTVADTTKRWQHPDTGVLIDRHQLQQMLSEAAQLAQQRLGGDLRASWLGFWISRLGLGRRLSAPRWLNQKCRAHPPYGERQHAKQSAWLRVILKVGKREYDTVTALC